jgi:hypothetical protein
MSQQKTYTFDKDMQLADGGAITASAAAQVLGADKILDLGAGRLDGVAVVDISAIDTVTGDEKYELELQHSNSATFASGVVTGSTLKVGGTTAVPGNSAATGVGRFELPFCNELQGVIYRYLRLYRRIAGTTPSITNTAWVAPA